jgi:hypothetical protein
MKQFVINIPNPIQGKGAKGFNRKPKRGQPTFSTFICYAENDKRARELTASHFGLRKIPDGTRLTEVASDPRMKKELFIDMSASTPEESVATQEALPVIQTYEVVAKQRISFVETLTIVVEATSEEEAANTLRKYQAGEIPANAISIGDVNRSDVDIENEQVYINAIA